MAVASIQATVDFYTQQEADLTNQVTDIMTSITQASKESTTLAQTTQKEKEAVKDKYTSGTTQYEDAISDIQDDYELKLSEITNWESELETKKQDLETQAKEASSYKESYQSALKSNVAKDFKYGDAS